MNKEIPQWKKIVVILLLLLLLVFSAGLYMGGVVAPHIHE